MTALDEYNSETSEQLTIRRSKKLSAVGVCPLKEIQNGHCPLQRGISF